MPTTVCQHCFVSGRVQGVFYRTTAAGIATEMKITGYVKNLADGRVELLACGEEKAVKEFCDWLWKGPDQAKVDDVTCEIVDQLVPDTFSTR